MKRFLFLAIAFVALSSHDMFLKLDAYQLAPNTAATVLLYNGTFDLSENTIDRDRMLDVSLVAGGTRTRIDTSQWREDGGTTLLDLTTGDPATYVVGVSTRPRNIEMEAEAFNGYLEHDGVLDMIEDRKENQALDENAVEKYSKHVKTIFQVGEQLTDDWQTALGYPIEFVPLSNPYALHAGEELQVQLLWQGEPLADQLVYLGSAEDHSHGDAEDHDHGDSEDHDHGDSEEEHHHHEATQLRTNSDGVLTAPIGNDGVHYLRTIYMVHSEEEGLTHESNWATLTFQVGHSHADGEQGHTHEDGTHHHHEQASIFASLPSYVYWIGSLAVVGGLFFWFNRKS